jgi:expansin (peptidoglycan-binding protein)
MARNWKKVIPTSHIEALRLCKDYAKEVRNLSVERIADEMGATADALYKWLANGTMPFNRIRSYQLACGCNFVTRYMASGDGFLLTPIPSGKNITDADMMELNQSFHGAMHLLAGFYQGTTNPQETLDALIAHMGVTGWHHANVQKHLQPELAFDEE